MNTNVDVRRHFDALADDYDVWKRKNSYYYALLKRFYSSCIPPGSAVVEFGCATGDILAATSPQTGLGVDLSERLIAHARRKYPAYEFVTADVQTYTAAGKFDYCIMSDLLDHVSDIPAAIANAYAHLKPGGRLVCTSINPLWNPLMDILERFRMKMPEGPHAFIPNRYLAMFCALKGFSVVSQKALVFLPRNIPFVSAFLNTVMPQVPVVNRLCWVQVIIAQKLQRPVRKLTYSVIIPAFNEEKNIVECIKRLPAACDDHEIIVVNDGSTDASARALQGAQNIDSRVRVVDLAVNLGKAAAVQEGIRHAEKDAIVILDADMAVAPEDIPLFIEALEQGLGRFINGTRLVYGMEKRAMSELKRIGNFLFALWFSLILKCRLTDTLCGTKAFFRSDFCGIPLSGEKWGDFALLAHAGAKRLRIIEMPVHYHERLAGSSKMSPLRDGLRFAWYLLKMAICNKYLILLILRFII